MRLVTITVYDQTDRRQIEVADGTTIDQILSGISGTIVPPVPVPSPNVPGNPPGWTGTLNFAELTRRYNGIVLDQEDIDRYWNQHFNDQQIIDMFERKAQPTDKTP